MLVSTGDAEATYRDLANEIASQIKESGRYDRVYFSGWQHRGACDDEHDDEENHGDRAIERLHEAIESCTVALLITSPFGKTSYEEFLAKRELSTWRDAFVVGARALLSQPFASKRRWKTVVAYSAAPAEPVDSFVHRDFAAAAGGSRLYNVQKAAERRRLHRSLLLGVGLGRKTMKAPNDCLLKYKSFHRSSKPA